MPWSFPRQGPAITSPLPLNRVSLNRILVTSSRLARVVLSNLKLAINIATTLFRLIRGKHLSLVERYTHQLEQYEQSSRSIALRGSLGAPSTDPRIVARNAVLTRANIAYQSGNFVGSTRALLEACDIEDDLSRKFGMSPQSTRLIGSEVLDSLGHCAAALSMRAILKGVGLISPGELWLTRSTGANAAYIQLWGQHFPNLELTRELAQELEIQAWPLFESISTVRLTSGIVEQRVAHNLAVQWMKLQSLSSVLMLPEAYEVKAKSALRQAGLDPDAPFISMHVRASPTRGYGRDADIGTYHLAIESALNRGYQVIRLGDPSMQPLRPRIGLLDYAVFPQRNDFLDTFLMAKCALMLGTTSGPINVAFSFGRPILWTNAPDIAKAVNFPRCTILPKLLLDQDGQVLPFRELVRTPSGWIDGRLQDANGIPWGPAHAWRDNSPEEIAAAMEYSLALLEKGDDPTGVEWPEYIPRRADLGPPPVDQAFWNKWALILE